MKNRLALLLFLLSISFWAPAQPKASFGLTGGISQTWQVDLDASAHPHALSIPGFSAGAFGSLPITETLRFQPELLFVRRTNGYTAKKSVGYGNNTVTTTIDATGSLDMIQIPLWFQFGRQTYVGIGLAYGFPIHIQGSSDVTTTSPNPSTTQHQHEAGTLEFKDAFQSKLLDIGFSVGRRMGTVGWEIRPSVSMGYGGHFWRSPTKTSTFQLTGLITWMK